MRRLAQYLCVVCFGVSLVLAVTGFVLWMASYSAGYYLTLSEGQGGAGRQISIARGVFRFNWRDGWLGPDGSRWFSKVIADVGDYSSLNSVYVPMWVLVGAAALTAGAFYRLMPSRYRKGCCRRCGYDLRASPERCPECATPVN
jgi:hypothetical protein